MIDAKISIKKKYNAKQNSNTRKNKLSNKKYKGGNASVLFKPVTIVGGFIGKWKWLGKRFSLLEVVNDCVKKNN